MPTSTLPSPVPIDLDGVAVATYRLEPEAAPARGDVALCHGTPWSAEVWAPVAQGLRAAGFRVHLWDMPGYGRSAMGEGVALGLDAQGARLAALLRHWGLERPHLVAHDIGGAVALRAHLLEGAELASLQLWDVVTLDPWRSPFFRLVAEHAAVFAALPPALHAALVREYIGGAAHGELGPARLDLLVAPWVTPQGQPAFYRQIAALRPEHARPLLERLGAVRCPVAIGWGEEDPWIPVEQGHRLREALPGDPPLTLLPEAGHLAPLEAGDAVLLAVLAQLTGA